MEGWWRETSDRGVLCEGMTFSYSTPYLAVKQGKKVVISCYYVNTTRNPNITWYKLEGKPVHLKNVKGVITMSSDKSSWFQIEKARKSHSGIYYCSSPLLKNTSQQCGAELNVITESIKKEKISTTYTMKDMLILIQGILLILCLTLPGMLFLNKNNQAKKNEEAETYHMYEGLEVMQTAMYEDIGNLKSSDAKWTAAEQPNE
ncbi:B-cell antigen receptor complex-associated protein beta chain-like isoform X2 [Mustelus asterias]